MSFKTIFRVGKHVSDEIQTSIYFIKYDLQTFIKTNISCKKGKLNIFWLNGDGKKIAYYESYFKKITKRNTT